MQQQKMEALKNAAQREREIKEAKEAEEGIRYREELMREEVKRRKEEEEERERKEKER